jgi:hypothetical protein
VEQSDPGGAGHHYQDDSDSWTRQECGSSGMLVGIMKLGASLLFNLLAACTGTLLVALLGAVGPHHQARDLVFTLIAFAFVVIVINHQESLLLAVQKSGRWRVPSQVWSTWSYETESGEIMNMDRIELQQIGRLVRGQGSSIAGVPPEHAYRIRGSLNPEGILEGRWESASGRNYYGSFQLVAQRDGEAYVGRWTGVSRENHVRAGEWEWATESGRPES